MAHSPGKLVGRNCAKGGISNTKGRSFGCSPLIYEMERAKRFELSTLTLARLCSTPELRPHPFRLADL